MLETGAPHPAIKCSKRLWRNKTGRVGAAGSQGLDDSPGVASDPGTWRHAAGKASISAARPGGRAARGTRAAELTPGVRQGRVRPLPFSLLSGFQPLICWQFVSDGRAIQFE